MCLFLQEEVAKWKYEMIWIVPSEWIWKLNNFNEFSELKLDLEWVPPPILLLGLADLTLYKIFCLIPTHQAIWSDDVKYKLFPNH